MSRPDSLHQQLSASLGDTTRVLPFQIDELNDKFVEARDEIEYAQEDAETTYFNESHKLARESVGIVTTMYKEILADLSEADKGKLQRSMGMKMEQLKVHICAACLVSCLSVVLYVQCRQVAEALLWFVCRLSWDSWTPYTHKVHKYQRAAAAAHSLFAFSVHSRTL